MIPWHEAGEDLVKGWSKGGRADRGDTHQETSRTYPDGDAGGSSETGLGRGVKRAHTLGRSGVLKRQGGT